MAVLPGGRWALLAVALGALALAAALAAAAAGPVARAATSANDPVHSDFNGDGYEDLAIGAASKRVDGQAQAGAVNVLYGGPNGLGAAGDQLLVSPSPYYRSFFGASVASGDFDGDGFADLIVGEPGRYFSEPAKNECSGGFHLFKGSAEGLQSYLYYHPARDLFPYRDVNQRGCDVGLTMATGDFDGDGFADAAIGMPGFLEDPTRSYQPTSGGVWIIYGSRLFGLDYHHVDLGNESRRPILMDAGRSVGRALAAGDHNGDGVDDLAVASLLPASSPTAPPPTKGKVKVFLGSATGLAATGTFHARSVDRLGHALAFGDYDGDGREELAIGVPYEGIPTPGGAFPLAAAAGTVDVWDTNGPERTWSQQGLGGVEPEVNDRFGWALAAADFDGDGKADLAIGVPFEDIGDTKNAGMVHVVRGSASGLTATDAVSIHQARPGVAGAPEAWDQFGWALGTGRLGKSAKADLAIGIPGEDIGSVADAGAVGVFYGSNAGPTATDSQFWSQNSTGIAGTPGVGDKFGIALR